MTALPLSSVTVEHIYISPGHNFVGHRKGHPGAYPLQEVDRVECVSGRGLQGDRFFDFKADYHGQVTFFAMEVYEDLCRATQVVDKQPGVLRRNVFVRGIDLNELIGVTFTLQGLTFSGSEECSPCRWMDQAFGAGAMATLKDRGGLRARILTSGPLQVEAR